MADHDKTTGMKSAYELALERLEQQGIERPREEGLAAETKDRMAEIRSKAEAKLAELEILHRDSRQREFDPAQRQEQEEGYQRERRRVEEDRDRKLAQIRGE